MSRTLRSRDRERKTDLAGGVAPEIEVAAARAWERMSERIGPSIAHELGIGKELEAAYGNVFKRKQGPHLRLLIATCKALELKPHLHQRPDVFAAIDFIEAQLGRRVIDVPRVRATAASADSRADQIALALLEVGDFFRAAAATPETWNAEQKLRVHQELQEAIGALSALANEINGTPKVAPVPFPAGPRPVS